MKIFWGTAVILSLLLTIHCNESYAANSIGSAVSTVEQSLTGQDKTVSPLEDNDFYKVCTKYSKQDVERFAQNVRQQILASDWAGLAENIAYPISISGKTYSTADALSKGLKAHPFNKGFLRAIQDASCKDMFCNSNGIMMGNGEIWINEILDDAQHSKGLRISAINAQ